VEHYTDSGTCVITQCMHGSRGHARGGAGGLTAYNIAENRSLVIGGEQRGWRDNG
jgi:hypothetical protein